MIDPLIVTARDLIRAAEKERDIAIGRARLLESKNETLKRQVADLQSELRPSGEVSKQQSEFAERVVHYVWRTLLNARDDGPDDEVSLVIDWLEYRLEQWSLSRERS